MKIILGIEGKLLARLLAATLLTAAAALSADAVFRPGQLWPDNNGVHINAHGGGMLYHEGVCYWFGESRDRGTRGVSCYSPKDRYNWKDEGLALDVAQADPTSVISRDNVIERPKVIYNRKAHKFVMWFHTELRGRSYDAAQTTVAQSDKATGPYAVIRSLRPDAGTWPLNMPAGQKEGPTAEREICPGPAQADARRCLAVGRDVSHERRQSRDTVLRNHPSASPVA
jgi:hypothetical protein